MTQAEWFDFMWNVASTLLAGGAWLYVWISNRHRATRDQIEEIDDKFTARCEEMDKRLVRCETQVGTMPSQKSLHELSLALEHLSGEARVIGTRLSGLENLVGRLERVTTRQEDFLLNRKQ